MLSLRAWNTAVGRKDLELSIQLFQGFVEYVASRSNDDDFSSFISMSYELYVDSDDNDDYDDDDGSDFVSMHYLIHPLANGVFKI